MMDWLLNIVSYNPDAPFQFMQLGFWIFFGAVLLGNAILYKKLVLRNLFLYLASLFFYYKTGGLFFILLIITTLIGYWGGKMIEQSQSRAGKKASVTLSVTLFVAMLSYFKYAPFLCSLMGEWFNIHLQATPISALFNNWFVGKSNTVQSFIFPIGISFFTFQGISYLVDVYRGKVRAIKSFVDFGFYVSFFPQLVSGPIVRAWEFIPQLYHKITLTEKQVWHALFLIMAGVFKKVIFSDYIALNLSDRIFTSPESYTGFEILLGVIGYALQIYADFSGYTDIAIGVALLLGFRLPTNFNAPYKATSITDFWRRWHISLSLWLRDYLYIPLGGNRGGKFKQSMNLIITMLLGGLWHGANLRFVLWGALHGIALVINKSFNWLEKLFEFSLPRWIGWILTFTFICFTWILFRSPDMATLQTILLRMGYAFSWNTIPSIISAYDTTIGLILLGFIIHFLPSSIKEILRGYFINLPTFIKITLVILFIVLIYQVNSATVQPFIYFKF